MKLKLDIDPDLVAMMAAEIAAGERALTAAMREAGAGLKLAWRGQIVGAGLGARLRRHRFRMSGAAVRAREGRTKVRHARSVLGQTGGRRSGPACDFIL
jgi:hypothetical protein